MQNPSPTEEQTTTNSELLALAMVSRASDIHALDLQYHKFSEEEVLFTFLFSLRHQTFRSAKDSFSAKF